MLIFSAHKARRERARKPEGFSRAPRNTCGIADKGSFKFDTRLAGNSNVGHTCGTALGDAERKALVA